MHDSEERAYLCSVKPPVCRNRWSRQVDGGKLDPGCFIFKMAPGELCEPRLRVLSVAALPVISASKGGYFPQERDDRSYSHSVEFAG